VTYIEVTRGHDTYHWITCVSGILSNIFISTSSTDMVLAQLRAFSSAKLLSSVDVWCQSVCLLTGHKLGNI